WRIPPRCPLVPRRCGAISSTSIGPSSVRRSMPRTRPSHRRRTRRVSGFPDADWKNDSCGRSRHMPPSPKASLSRRVTGALLLAMGAIALSAPLAVGRWSLAILGIPLLLLGVAEAYAAFTSQQRAQVSAYLPSLLALLAGNLLLLSSALVLDALLI